MKKKDKNKKVFSKETLFKIFKFKVVDFIIIPVIALIVATLILIPKINLVGKKVVVLNYKDSYVEKGAKVNFLGSDISNNLDIDSNVDTSKIGEYEVTYNLKGFIIPIKKKRVVRVIDSSRPVITLVGDKEVKLCPNKKYEEQGFSASDNVDGDLTKKVIITNLENKIIYEVKDSSSNTSKVTRKLIYEDTEGPVINLNGLNEITYTVGSRFTDPGYSAVDNCDGDITDKVKIEGDVDTNTIGEYTVTYSVSDNASNSASVSRKFKVTKSIDPDSGIRKSGVIYLTFDDGPQEGTTNVILDILKEEGVKATFFVTNKGPDYLIKRESDEGHTVALHTATHDYAIVYASADSYFNDLQLVHDRVYNITGIDSRIIRFPGGSSNTVSRRYSNGIMSYLTTEVLNRGYRYYDWNISSGDAGGTTDPNQVYWNVVNGLSHDRPNMVLCHDIKTHTRDALRNIIKYGKDNGYSFEPITMETYMIRQRVNN